VHLISAITFDEEKYIDLFISLEIAPKVIVAGKGMKQSDLIGVLSLSSGLISSIVNSKRQISKEKAKKLGAYFNASPSLFI
jgi:HTH-type transcriptional regulator / antitoxin HigA